MRLKDWAMLRGISFDIQHLNCSGQELTSLEGLAEFRQLTWLECDGNRLTWLPNMAALQYLNTIHASRNQLASMGSVPWSLTHINLSHNALTELPSFGDCPRLQYLNCAANRVEKVEDLSQTSLLYIDLRHNLLRRKPSLPDFTQHVLLDGNPLDEEDETSKDDDITTPS